MKKLLAIFCAALFLIAFSVPAMAATKIGGILFVDWYYVDESAESAMGGRNKSTNQNLTENDFERMEIEVPDNSRIYIRWTNEDNVGMYFETGHAGDDGAKDVNLRHAYGWWQVNPGFKLMVGHSTTPFSPINPSQLIGMRANRAGGAVYLNVAGLGYGNYYSGRFPQVRGTFNLPNKMGRFEVALIDPHGGANTQPGAAVANGTVREETTLPRFDVAADLYLGALKIYPSFFWQTKDFDQAAAGYDDSYESWGLSLGLKFAFGPLNFAGEINYGENWGETRGVDGLSPAAKANAVRFVDPDGDGAAQATEDSESLGWWIDVSFKLGAATPHLIVGSFRTENDGTARLGTADDIDIEAWMYGISIPIKLAKGFSIRPEIFVYDDGDDELNNTDNNGDGIGDRIDYGDHVLVGVKFQIVF